MNKELFSRRLKETRKQRNLTMEELAHMSGTTKSAISYYEKGEKEPLLGSVYDIAKALDVPLSYLIGEELSLDNKIDIISNIVKKKGIDIGFINAHKLPEDELMRLEEDLDLAFKIIKEKYFKE